ASKAHAAISWRIRLQPYRPRVPSPLDLEEFQIRGGRSLDRSGRPSLRGALTLSVPGSLLPWRDSGEAVTPLGEEAFVHRGLSRCCDRWKLRLGGPDFEFFKPSCCGSLVFAASTDLSPDRPKEFFFGCFDTFLISLWRIAVLIEEQSVSHNLRKEGIICIQVHDLCCSSLIRGLLLFFWPLKQFAAYF
ncbi:hypothetical protein BHE74_00034812, partial [Ensete ventricosum]